MKREEYREIFDEDLCIQFKLRSLERHHFHVHSQYEILFSLSNNLNLELENRLYSVPKNSLILLTSYDLHHMYSKTVGDVPRYVLYFSPNMLLNFTIYGTDLFECFYNRKCKLPQILSLNDAEAEQAKMLFNKLERFVNQKKDYGNKLRSALTLADLVLFVNDRYRKYHSIIGSDTIKNRVLAYEVVQYVGEHYSDKISIETIAKKFYTSKSTLYRVFRSTLAVSPNQYIIDFRTVKAKELLLSGYTVDACCHKVGYDNASYFSRVFKLQTGMSPKQYQLSACNR